jgi:hypothetical protein
LDYEAPVAESANRENHRETECYGLRADDGHDGASEVKPPPEHGSMLDTQSRKEDPWTHRDRDQGKTGVAKQESRWPGQCACHASHQQSKPRIRPEEIARLMLVDMLLLDHGE